MHRLEGNKIKFMDVLELIEYRLLKLNISFEVLGLSTGMYVGVYIAFVVHILKQDLNHLRKRRRYSTICL